VSDAPAGAQAPETDVVRLTGVGVVRDGVSILRQVDWRVGPGERWVILGPNGSGKSTLCQIVSMYLHPSTGDVHVLGAQLGRVDVRTHRLRIGLTSAALASMMQPSLTAEQLVVAGKHAALAHWWHEYGDEDWARARDCLARVDCAGHASQTFGTLSSGERQRVLMARALMTAPDLLVLDEPTAGLDLGGRERLIRTLATLADDPAAPALVLVTHHVDEIPPGFTHACLLSEGQVHAAGPMEEVLTSERLSGCFGLSLEVERRARRWRAWASEAPPPL